MEGLEDFAYQSKQPIVFSTAGGEADGSCQVDLRIPGMEVKVSPYVLDSTPAVLSVGRRRIKEGYAFYWAPHSERPIMVSPGGKIVPLAVDGYIPYIVTEQPAAAAVAAPASASGERLDRKATA